MMFFLRKPRVASGFTSGTISGTSGSMRQAEELSITTGPCLPILGAHSLENLPETDIRTMSTLEKSNVSTSLHFRIFSPNATSRPMDLREATAKISSTGNSTSSRMFSISRPTLPVAPTTATR